jgi:hypothetical protein
LHPGKKNQLSHCLLSEHLKDVYFLIAKQKYVVFC